MDTTSRSAWCSACHAVQGIDARARVQLLALAMTALEQQVAALPVAAAEASQAEWRLVVAALLASCSVAAARAWLGYVPAELQRQAAAAVRPLHAGIPSPATPPPPPLPPPARSPATTPSPLPRGKLPVRALPLPTSSLSIFTYPSALDFIHTHAFPRRGLVSARTLPFLTSLPVVSH